MDVSVGEALYGGTHAFVAYADGENGEKYVLKMDMPEDLGGEFSRSMAALKTADGHGYVKLFAYDPQRKACLLERLGKPINQLGYSVDRQIEIICSALKKAWITPARETDFPSGLDSVMWFRQFIGETWEKLHHPCSLRVIQQVFSYLQSREKAMKPSEFVLLHGDAHGGNTLITLDGDDYQLIDPDGIFYEKEYDLGVLMREWVEEYTQKTVRIFTPSDWSSPTRNLGVGVSANCIHGLCAAADWTGRNWAKDAACSRELEYALDSFILIILFLHVI